MASIHISREHTLGLERARNAVERLASSLDGNLGISYRWEGDTLDFEHPDARGSIVVDEAVVTVDVKLGMMLGVFKGAVEKQITGYLDENLK